MDGSFSQNKKANITQILLTDKVSIIYVIGTICVTRALANVYIYRVEMANTAIKSCLVNSMIYQRSCYINIRTESTEIKSAEMN